MSAHVDILACPAKSEAAWATRETHSWGARDAPTSQSYTMAVIAPAEQTAMASATTVTRSAGLAAGPSVGTALWTAIGPNAPFLVGGVVKIAYDLTLWWMFRQVKPPEEVADG